LYRGMNELMRFYGFFIAGGDIIRSYKSMVSIMLVGELISKRALTRSGAKKGDVLMASGPLGLAAAGLKILQKRARISPNSAKILLRAHTLPRPKMKEGRILAEGDISATSLTDTSGALMTCVESL